MNIALMTNNYKPITGGVPVSIERLAGGLRAMGHKVTIFAPTYDNQPQYEEGVFRYKTLVKRFLGGVVLPNAMDPAIERKFKEENFDVVHVHHPVLIGNTALFLSKKYNIPLVFTYHTRYEQYLSYAVFFKRLEDNSKKNNIIGSLSCRLCHVIYEIIVPSYIRFFARKCDLVLAPTPGMKEYLMENCRIIGEKISVLPTGLEEDEYVLDAHKVKEIRSRYIKNGETLFVSVSRISHEKNIEFLIEACLKLKEKTAMPFKLLMVGDGPDKEKYRDICEKKGLSEIEFVGCVNNKDIKNYCRAADAFLFASKSETQGIVIIEALATGTPVIALRAGGVEDVVMSGINGILSGESVDEFADSVYAYMRGEVHQDLLSANALFTALEFKEDKIAQRASEMYLNAINMHEEKNQDEGNYGRKISHIAG